MPTGKNQGFCGTLEEVGAKAGCSPATVSRVLNNSGPVSRSVRQSVLRVVQEAGYVPRRTRKLAARSAPKGEIANGLVEVVLHRCTPTERVSSDADGMHFDPHVRKIDGETLLSNSYNLAADFYMRIIGGVMDELAAANRRALLQTTDSLMSPKLMAEINRAGNRVLLLGEYSRDRGELDRFIERCESPLVLIDMIYNGRPDVVTIDNVTGVGLAMDHLLSLGHRDIGFVGAPSNPSFEERWIGFQWKMAAAGLPVRPQWLYHGLEHIENTAHGVEQILRQDRLPTAFVCVNDWHAMGVVRAAERCGVSVPGQLSVVGFDDVSAAGMITPPLTTLHVPLRQMGQQAVRQMLVNDLFDQSQRPEGCIIRLRPQLVVRQSTGPVAARS